MGAPMRVLVVLLVVIAVVAFALVVRSLGGPVQQPIAFNHLLHIEEVGLECVDCHLYAQSGVHATIPNIELCADCHEEPEGDSPDELQLVEYIQDQSLIPWRKIYWVPSHVYFSHRRHTQAGGIECETCHGDIGSRQEPVDRTLVDLSMNACIDCHDETGTSNDCLLCHR